MTMGLILKREKIELNINQIKIVKSGWGGEAVENSTVEKIVYLSDGLEVKGFLAYPKNPVGKLPCIIWCRGGFGEQGRIDSFSARGMFGEIASWGYVVFASQLRSKELDEFGGRDLNDVLNLVSLAKEIEFADSENWGIEGWSRGGMMTYLALAKLNIFRASVTIGGIADLRSLKQDEFILKYLKGKYGRDLSQSKLDEFFNSRSAINFAEKISPQTAMLLIHGAKDERVPVENSINLAKKLVKQNRLLRLVVLEEGDHFLKNHRKEVSQLKKFWFDKYLKKGNTK